jgi:hypothetical protein
MEVIMFNPVHSSLELLQGASLRDAFLKYVVQTELSHSPLGNFARRIKELSMADTDYETADVVLYDLGVDNANYSQAAIMNIMNGGWQCFAPNSKVRGRCIGIWIHSYGYSLTTVSCDDYEPWGSDYYTTLPPTDELLRWSQLEADEEEPAERTETCVRCAEDVPEDDISGGLCSWCTQLTR